MAGPSPYRAYEKRAVPPPVEAGLVRPGIQSPQPSRPSGRQEWASAGPSSLPSTPRRLDSPGQPRPTSARSAQGRVRAPYHPSFQAAGVKRDRSDEFTRLRRAQGEGKKLEEGRLARRLEKLVALHFPSPQDAPPPIPASRLSLATISDFGGSLRGKSPLQLWRTVAGAPDTTEQDEQLIVKWQDDADAARCPICTAQFGLKTRRHHCRLCGRVVCFLPPTPQPALDGPISPSDSSSSSPLPSRRDRCSTFITYEYEDAATGGEKDVVGTVIEIETAEVDLSLGGMASDLRIVKEKDERKKVRVCRECLHVVLRQQSQSRPVPTPGWFRSYETLVKLEQEIESALPEFQELVLGLQKPDLVSTAPPSSLAAQNLRKSLLRNLAAYDQISKRIRDLPLSEGSYPGGSQDRLQRAMAAKATLYLTQKLGVLRTLGNVDEATRPSKKQVPKDLGVEGGIKSLKSLLGESEEVVQGQNAQLAVLLEQEALVKGYVVDANLRRHFDDANSLKASLAELREEIARIRAGMT